MQRERWQTFTFNAEDTARDYPWIVSPQRNKDLADEFGTDSDIYRIRVLGEFPHIDPNCVISAEQLERCTDRREMLPCAQRARPGGVLPARQFGMDIARFGGDESVIFRRSGQAVMDWQRFAHAEPNHVVNEAFRMQADAGWGNEDTWYVCDAGGMGQGIMANFYDAQKHIFEFHNGGKATEVDYGNKITQAWFHFARQVRSNQIYIPRDNHMIQQLCTRQYFTDLKGKLVLEKKDDYIKRGHDSPDRADAIVLCFWDEVEALANLAQADPSESVGLAFQ
jgi:hypothetical protein